MSHNYTEKDIRTIEDDREYVRMRSTNYIPDTSTEGMVHIAFEVLDNSIDEAINSKKSNLIKFIVDEDQKRITVIDNGRGIPHGKLLDAATKLKTSGKFENGEKSSYRTSGGTNGIGLKLATYLSTEFMIQSKREGSSLTYIFKNGFLVDDKKEPSKDRGTTVTYILDDECIDTSEFSYEIFQKSIKQKSYIFPEVEFNVIKLHKDHVVKNKTYVGKSVLNAVEEMKPDTNVIRVKTTKYVTVVDKKLRGTEEVFVDIDLAFAYKESLIEEKDTSDYLISFVNSINTTLGGTHVQGLKEGLVKFFRQYIGETKLNILPNDMMSAICAFVAVAMSKVEFRGQYKDQLNSDAARIAVRDAVYEALCNEKDQTVKKMANFIKDVAKSREASKKSREKKTKTAFSKDSIEKFYDLQESDKTFARELYIGEGDSATDSFMNARDIYNHAVIPMSRPSNLIDKKLGDLQHLKSNFHDLLYVIGVDLGKKIRKEDLNYDKIILALDGDIDGDGMSAAYLALITKFVPELFEWGLVYRLVPPLYKFTDKKGKQVFLSSQKEFNKHILNEYCEKNVLSIGKRNMNKESIRHLVETNFNYAKELDKLTKKINGVKSTNDTALLVEKLMWYYNPSLHYDKKDVKFFEKILKDYPYLKVSFKKDVLVIDGTVGSNDDLVHIIFNSFLKGSVKRFKDIQSQNLIYSSYKLNGEPASIYTIMKSIDKSMPKDIDRIKGLGELDAFDFATQCMNPKNRTLIRMVPSKNPKRDLEIAYKHYSKKSHYKAMRAKLVSELVCDEELLDT